jgi:rhamnose transport system ATP-binding protein
MNSPGEVLVSTHDIGKSFSGVNVLRHINLQFFVGEVHAVIGENGAGKSTLMNVIAGVHRPTDGYLSVAGEPVEFRTPHDAISKGIALIHQEPLTFGDLDIAENIFAGHTRKDHTPFVRWKDIYARSREILRSLDVDLNPHRLTANLSTADQQMVEIANALSQNAQLIIMDEPTASLTPGEAKKLFDIVRRLQTEQQKTFVFISHRLEEVMEIADRITVLRDGNFVGTTAKESTNKRELIQMMIGRELKDHIHREKTELGETALEVRDLHSEGVFSGISFSVRRGEILGIAGLVGAGRSEIARAIFGVDPLDGGEVLLFGKPVKITSPRNAIQLGLAYVPEDRQHEGLFLPHAIAANMTYSVPDAIARLGWIDHAREQELCKEYAEALHIRMANGKQPVQQLSGGNQQKTVVAKWLLPEPQVLILDEPTRGIDVGAKEEVYRIINDLTSRGKAIVMISSELPEITALSDRVIVIKEGTIARHLEKEEITDAAVMEAATQAVVAEAEG